MLKDLQKMGKALSAVLNKPLEPVRPPPLPPPASPPPLAVESRGSQSTKAAVGELAKRLLVQEATLRKIENAAWQIANAKDYTQKNFLSLSKQHRELQAELKKHTQAAAASAASKAESKEPPKAKQEPTPDALAEPPPNDPPQSSEPPPPLPKASGASPAAPAEPPPNDPQQSKPYDEALLAFAAANALKAAQARESNSGSSRPQSLSKGVLIQVSSEKAPKTQIGDVGTIVSVTDGTVWYTPVGSKTGLDKKCIPAADVVALSKFPDKRADKKRQMQFLSGAHVKALRESWLGLGFAAEPLEKDTQLDYTELNAGAFETLWRVLPPRTVYFRPDLTRFLALGSTAEIGWELLRDELKGLLSRCELALLPIWGIGPGHWTLLALEREDSASAAPALHVIAPSAVGTERARDPVRAQLQVDRQHETALILDPKLRPELPAALGWKVRYYETLCQPHLACWRQAQATLTALGIAAPVPEPHLRENQARQRACECGFWCLHYLEEEARRKRGEGKWTFLFDWGERLSLLSNIVNKLKTEEEKAQTAKILKDRKCPGS